MDNPLDIFSDKAEIERLLGQLKKGKSKEIDEEKMRQSLKQRVRGQDHVIDDLASFIRRQWGKEKRSRPIASVLFVGPPATGKTELAKSLAEFLFDDEKNMLRFDCSEFSGPEGKVRLIGTPTGYVGANQGGQLTRPMFSNPRRLILFDEIEKAWSGVFDLFLSVMGDGRLTEQGSGKAADYTQSIIVLTSNALHDQMQALLEQVSDPEELSNAIKTVLRESNTFRPEIISRFDRVYVFKPLEGIVNAEIAVVKIRAIAKEYGLELTWVDPRIVMHVMTKADEAKDTRELTRIAEKMLADDLLAARRQGHKKVRALFDDEGRASVVGDDKEAS